MVGILLVPDFTLADDPPPPRRGPRDSSSDVKLEVSTVSWIFLFQICISETFNPPEGWHLPEAYYPGCQARSENATGELSLLGFSPENQLVVFDARKQQNLQFAYLR